MVAWPPAPSTPDLTASATTPTTSDSIQRILNMKLTLGYMAVHRVDDNGDLGGHD